jgi:ATP-dependent Clp protease protease subunit
MSTVIHLFSAIGSGPGEVTAKAFVAMLPPSGDVLLRVNSGGGDVAEALAIVSLIGSHSGKFTARVDGIAASAASLIVASCPVVEMAETALLMLHPARVSTAGTADDLRAAAGAMDAFTEQLRTIYARRSKLPQAELEAALTGAERWFTAEEALAAGFADKILEAATSSPRAALAAPVLNVCVIADLRRDLESLANERDTLRAQIERNRIERIEAAVAEIAPVNADRAAMVAFCAKQSDDGTSFLASIPRLPRGADPINFRPSSHGSSIDYASYLSRLPKS